MTRTRSEFGALSERLEALSPAPARRPITHAWLDTSIPVLLLQWRRTTHGSWEGQVLGAADHGPAITWVAGHRLTPVRP